MTFIGIQIYLIIGFMFAEVKRRVLQKSDLFLFWGSPNRVDSPDISYRRSGQVLDTKRRRKVDESRTRWLIINATWRPPDIIFLLSLPLSTYCRRSKNAWAQTSEFFFSGRAMQRTVWSTSWYRGHTQPVQWAALNVSYCMCCIIKHSLKGNA